MDVLMKRYCSDGCGDPAVDTIVNLRAIAEDRGGEPKDDRTLWMTRRQAIIMELGAIEDYLGMERSIVPKRKREQPR